MLVFDTDDPDSRSRPAGAIGCKEDMDQLYWDDAYAVALALMERHPNLDPLTIEWETLHRWVVELPEFADDPDLKHLGWLRDIQKEWYEEVSS